MSLPLLNAEYSHPFEHWIRYRTVRQNKNFLAVFLGEPGSGKSWASISLGEGTDPNFGIDNVAASAKEMLEFLTSRTHIKKGTTVVLDEAGVNFSSRKWMTKENRYLGELFQTFRWMNISLLMTLPNFSFLDVQMRRLIQFSFDNPSIDEANKICFTRGRYWKQDPFSDKEPSKYLPFIRYPDGKLAKVAKIGFRKASSELLDAYEKKKKSWNLDMLDKTRKVLVEGHDLDRESKESNKKTDKDWEMKYEIDDKLKKIADNIVNNIDEYTIYKGQKKGWNFNTTAIRADYVMSGMDSLRVVRYLSKKDHVKEYVAAKNESAKKGVGV